MEDTAAQLSAIDDPSSSALARIAIPAARCRPAMQWQITLSPWKIDCRSTGQADRHCPSRTAASATETVKSWVSGSWIPPRFSNGSAKHFCCIDTTGKCWRVLTIGSPDSQRAPPDGCWNTFVGASAVFPREVASRSKYWSPPWTSTEESRFRLPRSGGPSSCSTGSTADGVAGEDLAVVPGRFLAAGLGLAAPRSPRSAGIGLDGLAGTGQGAWASGIGIFSTNIARRSWHSQAGCRPPHTLACFKSTEHLWAPEHWDSGSSHFWTW